MSVGRVVTAGLVTAALLGSVAGDAGAQAPAPRGAAAAGRLLDVPFVPQSPALCGGAAVAMVFRYWGAAAVYAEDFAALVNETAEGIRLGDLTRAVRDRGWRAQPFAGTAADLRRHVAQGRPIIALIEDRPGRHHYVVVVAWTDRTIVFHDPAHGPFRVREAEPFEAAWAVTGRTALLILPPGEPPPPIAPAGGATSVAADGCSALVAEAVPRAREGDLQTAEALLLLVRDACPRSSAGPRELAGIRFLQERWSEAAAFAVEAVDREPGDLHAWHLLAASRFLMGEPARALDAWNRRGEPRVDLARVDGLARVRYDVIARLLDVPSQAVLTERQLQRAARRVAALPAAELSRVSYTPLPGGRATVDAAIVERPVLPRTAASVALMAAHAGIGREGRLDVASPSGGGELWSMGARWWSGRPRVAVGVAAPHVWRLPGVTRVEGSWERQTYGIAALTGTPAGGMRTPIQHERRRASVTVSDWWSGDLRWEAQMALDHWDDRGRRPSGGLAIEHRSAGDRLAVRAETAVWPGSGRAAAFATSGIGAAWRSSGEATAAWRGVLGLWTASPEAPLDLWPGAGTGHARAPLLRAHPLIEDGAVRLSGLGRRLLHATIEGQRPLVTGPIASLQWAAFLDTAALGRGAVPDAAPWHLDAGVGVRARLPGSGHAVRIDLARGLRDGRMALSIGWQRAWPGW